MKKLKYFLFIDKHYSIKKHTRGRGEDVREAWPTDHDRRGMRGERRQKPAACWAS